MRQRMANSTLAFGSYAMASNLRCRDRRGSEARGRFSSPRHAPVTACLLCCRMGGVPRSLGHPLSYMTQIRMRRRRRRLSFMAALIASMTRCYYVFRSVFAAILPSHEVFRSALEGACGPRAQAQFVGRCRPHAHATVIATPVLDAERAGTKGFESL